MSDTILSTRWIVYYDAENGQKRIARDTTVTPTVTDTVNALYSALQDLFDELTQMDDGTVMSAQTPTAYTIGKIDSGDANPWYIDQESTEYLTGGAITSTGWARVEGTNTGIISIDYTETVALISTDIGKTIVMTTDGDSGTILDYNDAVTPKQIIIRPDSDATANSFDNTPTALGAFTITSGTGTGSQATGASTTGEWLYSNITSVGLTALQDNTTLAVYQDGSTLTSYKNATDWWGFGNIDLLIPVKQDGALVDEGFLTVIAQRPQTLHSFFITDVSAGGSNPIPLAAGADLDDSDGNREMIITTGATAEPTVGEIIEDDTDSTIQGVITSVTGTNPNVTLQYYLIGDPLNDFTGATGSLTGQTSGFTAAAVAPSDVNGAVANGITITHANTGVDVDQDGTSERYSVTVDCNNQLFSVVYPRIKYLTRRGETTTTATDGIEGQQYLGIDNRIAYTAISGTIAEGTVVTQVSTGATGTVVAHHTTDQIITLRNSRGTFDSTNQIDEGANNVTGPTSVGITPITSSPFGTYPGGGTLFFAPGVVPINVNSVEVNNYSVTDDTGTVVVEPTSVSVSIGNTREFDSITVFRLTGSGGTIDKSEYSSTVQTAGATTVITDEAGGITSDTPGKATGGSLTIVDISASQEYTIRYSSWTSSTLALANTSGTATSGDTSTLNATGSTFQADGVKVGDIIRRTSGDTEILYVKSIVSETQLTTTVATAAWGIQTFQINDLPITTATDDTFYVPIIYSHETTGTDGSPGDEGISMVYVADIDVRIKARQGGVIVPYAADAKITSSGLSNNVIRTEDTIHT